jgi:hypothetical protein
MVVSSIHRVATPVGISTGAGARVDATKVLLTCGMIAGPIYLIVASLQVFFRKGFDLNRHAISLLSNGSFGWIQVTNFVVTGSLVVACAVGMRRALYPGKACTWGPILLGLFGLGIIGTGIFIADPALGFPPGTPEDETSITWIGVLHFIAGLIGFFALTIASFVFARRFFAFHQFSLAWFSLTVGLAWFASFISLTTRPGNSALVVVFYLSIAMAWTWLSVISWFIMRHPQHEVESLRKE